MPTPQASVSCRSSEIYHSQRRTVEISRMVKVQHERFYQRRYDNPKRIDGIEKRVSCEETEICAGIGTVNATSIVVIPSRYGDKPVDIAK